LRADTDPGVRRALVRARAAAKINPALLVGPRRDDGYHDLVSVMQAVALWDEVEVTPAPEGFELDVSGGALPADESNLVLVAARELSRRARDHSGARFRLRKGIPVAAGLGGGSADGAAALLALDRLWSLRMPTMNLRSMAAEVGSDVPFCLDGGTQLALGRGERLTPVKVKGTLWWVLGIDAGELSTAAVYKRYDELGGGRRLDQGDVAGLLAALADGDLERIGAGLVNDLELAAFDLRPDLAQAKRRLREAGAVGALLGGSGATVLGLARDEDHAERLARSVRGAFARVEVARAPVPGVAFG
jgi:4-diphosphocytidyl-2-C-methyl-D-erythritol kinase